MSFPEEISTNCIILTKIDYGETASVVKAVSPDYGLLSFIAKGIRKPKSKFREELQLFSEINVLLKGNCDNSLYYFIDAQIINNYVRGVDFESTVFIQAISELYLQIFHYGESQFVVYELWKRFSEYIVSVKKNKILIFWRFCFRLFYEAGINIPSDFCGFCGTNDKPFRGFSPIDNSFVCEKCFSGTLEKRSLRISDNLSFIIKNIYSIGNLKDKIEFSKSDQIKMNQIIKIHLGEAYHHRFHLRSLDLLY
ncbi:MAG: DNA repair protein RecO [Candidatus Cloacimonadota bacterium]|nr:MAG: DNA repair protein RecO [Candidatus Cloacimonadota bacterium]